MNEKKKITMLIAIILIFIIVIFFAVKCSNQEYSITFDSRGGNKIDSQEIKRGGKIDEPEEPTREGYKFLGWYVDDKEFDFSKKIDKNVKLVAKWKKIESATTYTVTFDSNGGTEVASKEVNEKEKVVKPTNPTKKGYTFKGWELDGKAYDFDQEVTKDITLKAVWVKNVATNNTTTNTEFVVNKEPDTTPSVPKQPVTPVIPGEDNNGNNNGENNGGEGQPVLENFTVTFNALNGENPTQVVVENGMTVTKPVDPTRKGYIFTGWMLNGKPYNFNAPVISDMTLVAAYEKDIDVAVVENLNQLREAVTNKVSTIVLANDILDIPETIVLDWFVTVDGNGKTLSFTNDVKDGILVEAVGVEITDVTVTMNDEDQAWGGHYAIQVYNGGATLTNVTATGADAALLVNSSKVTIEGTMNVAGNQFGGIEVSKGKNAGNASSLIVSGTLENSSEVMGQPTIWIDGDHTNVSVTAEGLTTTTNIVEGQTQYYIDAKNTNTAVVTTKEELVQALAHPAVTTIEIANDITNIDTTIELNRAVTINANEHALSFVQGVKDGIQVFADGTTINDLHIIMNSAEGWQGNYGMQVYLAQNVTINNYAAEGADAAMLVNGGTVTATGTIVVSNNEFGGIELSSGKNVTTDSLLNIKAYVINETEAYGLPTIWIDGESDSVIEGMTKIMKDGQAQFYILEENSVEPVVTEPTVEDTVTVEELAQ